MNDMTETQPTLDQQAAEALAFTDIGQWNFKRNALRGAWCEVKAPDNDKTPTNIRVKLMGMDTPEAVSMAQQFLAVKETAEVTEEQAFEYTVNLVLAVIVDVQGLVVDGEAITVDTIEPVLREYDWMARQLFNFVANRHNYFLG